MEEREKRERVEGGGPRVLRPMQLSASRDELPVLRPVCLPVAALCAGWWDVEFAIAGDAVLASSRRVLRREEMVRENRPACAPGGGSDAHQCCV